MSSEQSYRNDLYDLLHSVTNARRIYREQGADAILRRPELLPLLIETVFVKDSKLDVKAAWVLELVCLYEIRLLIPYRSEFSKGLLDLKDESSIRPVSKICSLLSRKYSELPWESFDPDTKWINELIGASFEWLTGEHKVAAKVFAMETLFYWGQKFDWIHEELISIIDRDFSRGSAGYKSRARKIMDKISREERMKRQK